MRGWLIVAAVCALACAAGCQTHDSVKNPTLNKLGQMSGLMPRDEEQIAALLDDVCDGMQSRRIFKVLAHVSRSYHDNEGRDYEALEAYLNEVFKKYKSIRITRVVPRIAVEGNRARAIETFGTVAEPQNPNVDPPLNVQGQVTVTLAKAGGQWQIVEWGYIL